MHVPDSPPERSSNRRWNSLQDEEAVDRARQGDAWAAELLVDRYRSLVEAKARAYFVLGADHEDVVQEGMIGLCKAIRDFRAERLHRFRPFAEICVTRQIISAVKTATRQKHGPLNEYVSLHQSIDTESGAVVLGDVLTRANERRNSSLSANLGVEIPELVEDVLTDLERSVLTFYLQGMTYQEMGASLMCHTKSVDNALQRVKRKIGAMDSPFSTVAP